MSAAQGGLCHMERIADLPLRLFQKVKFLDQFTFFFRQFPKRLLQQKRPDGLLLHAAVSRKLPVPLHEPFIGILPPRHYRDFSRLRVDHHALGFQVFHKIPFLAFPFVILPVHLLAHPDPFPFPALLLLRCTSP